MITRNGEVISFRGSRRLNFGDVVAFFKRIGFVFKHWSHEAYPVITPEPSPPPKGLRMSIQETLKKVRARLAF
ncbi:MAG: hypothetical protein ABSF56_02435 [Minisyncoccia bacterium]|jgi:hypothetical protein